MIIQQQQLQQNMSSSDQASLEEFPHFKTQWSAFGNCYKHLYSSDLCELRLLRRLPVKELDLYSSREAYSFPFCPRIYKYSIERNELIESQIAFDIKLLLEYVPHRLDDATSNDQIIPRTIDILRALQYLRLRFGPFRIKKGMIGWTALGIAKVWINQDFSANFVEEEAVSEEEMLADLSSIFLECETFNLAKEQHPNSLISMIEVIEENLIEKNRLNVKKKALKQIQNFDNSEFSLDRQQHKDPLESYSTKSRKNITFSYSNKDIDGKAVNKGHNASKRSSIALIDDDFRIDRIESLSRMPPKKGLSFSNSHHQSSSLKIIQQKKANQQKKMSVFRPIECHAPDDGVKIKKLSDHFSMVSQMNSENQIPRIVDIYRHSVQERPEHLHFSTSSNPYSKFVAKQAKQADELDLGESSELSNNQIAEDASNCSKGEQMGPINELQRQLTEFTIGEKRQSGEQAQQLVKDDLDALFNSDHQFDYGELENELDHVLF